MSVVPVAAERLGAARLGYSLTVDVSWGKSVQFKGSVESVIMADMAHEIRVAIQRREHQTIRRLKILEDRRRDGQALSHVIATRCEEATLEIITVLEVGRRIIHVRRCE